MPTIDNLYALSELLQVPIDAIVCGNREPLMSDVTIELHNARDQKMYAYYKKIKELQAA